MVTKLKRRFILLATLSVSIMLLVMNLVTIVINYSSLDQSTDLVINQIIKETSEVVEPAYETERDELEDVRYFITYYNDENVVLDANLSNINTVSNREAKRFTDIVLEKGKPEGLLGALKYQLVTINGKDAIIFLDASESISSFRIWTQTLFLISLVAILMTFIITNLLANRAVKPIMEAYDKQKQFITNASHEIKTPLTVISANMDILEMSIGENKWISNTSDQVVKLNRLVNDLTSLTRLQEQQYLERNLFDLSSVAKNSANEYSKLAKHTGLNFTSEISSNLEYLGNETAIIHVLDIIFDNSIKYTNQGGDINFKLVKANNKLKLSLTNTLEHISIGKHNEFLERFYKEDNSREQYKNSFGIGLSLAKEIIDLHHGKIQAYSLDEHSLTIDIIL